MQIATDEAMSKVLPVRRPWLTRKRVVVYSLALLICQLVLLGAWAIGHWGLHLRGVPPLGLDFRVTGVPLTSLCITAPSRLSIRSSCSP
jgi:hypothetical protein